MKPPLSTYRVQFTPDFPFEAGAQTLEYLAALGVSHLYASPIFAAAPGSQHGYDVVNMNALNDELGGIDGLRALSRKARDYGLGWVQDIVPNHRAFDSHNTVLMDVLENGAHSPNYRFFDIFWDHPYENIRGRVLAPFLGDFFGRVLERGELRLGFDERGFCVHYWDRAFPIRPESYAEILAHDLSRLRHTLGSHDTAFVKITGIIRFFEHLDKEREADREFDPVPSIKKLLWELYRGNESIRQHIERNLALYNGDPADPGSFERLHSILSRQHYRLSYWKVGTEELNYRRFFSINDLISVRVEDEEVFDRSHSLLFQLVEEGIVDGVRVDHLDGLYNPGQYVERLRTRCPDLYIVAEKILEHGEKLPPWPVQGTTGYDFLAHASGLFIDPASQEKIEDFYSLFTGSDLSWGELVLEKKRMIVGKHMAGDIDNLALMLKDIANRYRFGADLTLYSLRRALVEILAQFPVYRTYATEEEISDADRELLVGTFDRCIEGFPSLANELDLIRGFLLGGEGEELPEEESLEWKRFLMRLQQYSGPVMAKGVEDTAYFIHHPLAALNEVGGNPGIFGSGTEEFHAFNRGRAADWPHAMNNTATHDTKWGEDLRARLAVLSELPDEWRAHVQHWHGLNLPYKIKSGRREQPSRNDEYLLYQALLAGCPFGGLHEDNFPQRLKDFLVKAAREAKTHTSWLNPVEKYERAFLQFAEAVIGEDATSEFHRSFDAFRKRIAFFGMTNGLSQTLLKCMVPGVPDVYQGCEFWDLSFVDPDNRRPVDYAARMDALRDINEADDRAALLHALLANPEDGRIKMLVLHESLRARRDRPELFANGEYEALHLKGPRSTNAVAFVRRKGNAWVLCAAGRLLARALDSERFPVGADFWQGTEISLPPGAPRRWMNPFTQQTVEARNGSISCEAAFPPLTVALLLPTEA